MRRSAPVVLLFVVGLVLFAAAASSVVTVTETTSTATAAGGAAVNGATSSHVEGLGLGITLLVLGVAAWVGAGILLRRRRVSS